MLQAAAERLSGQIAGTGGWDTYRQSQVGEITLQSGRQRLVLRSAGRIRNALMDFKSIKLVPAGP